MNGQYSMRSPAVKRLMREAQELREPTEQFYAHPLDDNLFEWHFTLRGPQDSEFDGGIYHGRIILPPDYPMKPPSIILLTPNGRFETNKKICLSISGHHPESWQPSWSIRTALLAIIGFMPTHGNGAIGSLDYTEDERKVLARRSREFKCPQCGGLQDILLPVTEASKAAQKEAKELASQIDFQGEKEKKESTSSQQSAENSEGASAASIAPSSGPSTPAPSTPSTPIPGTPGSPTFPMPFGNFPGMMNPAMMQQMRGMMNPAMMQQMRAMMPQAGTGQATPQMPPMFMPPFWNPSMMAAMQGGAPRGAQPPNWPPGMPQMFNSPQFAQMMQMRPPGVRSSPAVSTPAPTTASSGTQPPVTSATPTRTSVESSPSTSSPRPVSTSSTAATTVTTSTGTRPTSSAAAPVPPATPDGRDGVRRRVLPTVRATHEPAPIIRVRVRNRQTENPVTLLVMAMICLLLAVLIVRRLYMMDAMRFLADNL